MSDRPEDKGLDPSLIERELAALLGPDEAEDAMPSPEELAAAQQMALLFDRTDQDAPIDESMEEALGVAHFLAHVAAPPSLSPARKSDIEAAVLGAWDAQPKAETTPPRQVAPKTRTPGLWQQLIGMFGVGPRLALGAAFVAAFAFVSLTWLEQKSPAPQPMVQQQPIQQAPRLLAANLSGSPWAAGHNPYTTTRSPSQRLQRVLEFNSQRALDAAIASQSQQHLFRLR